MRHGTPNRRSRNNRGHGGGGGGGGNRQGGGAPNRMQVFDSNGPDVRIRGTAHQIVEKYLALAKDASSSGDLVVAESYLQHAEHYQRMINTWNEQMPRVEQGQQSDAVDKAFQPQPDVQPVPQASKKDDLGLPSSILGPKREASKTELADA